MFTIETIRLGFIPMTIESIEAAMSGEQTLQQYLQINVETNFIQTIHQERVFPLRLEKLKKNPEISKWYGFIAEKKSNTVIGMMGFKTPPNNSGLIEIGYGINEKFQGNGYASEMASGLKDWAFQQEGVKGITATNIRKDNIASIKIVKKLGMNLIQKNDDTIDFMILKESVSE
ncbi:RimJ/RimL family protein N-acetyltransferase [Salirhabdus euzebyi]|uniref:RimJ/RimL family protein N-acetyltransferase n=1 Tax=Salirhabdus euzebyi TaxID=394506 RepID=A0A841PWZ3_9BACI|nr:GNAT family N-acetyltransferase [Salirhabdus euzebyi]MBB6452474.1 RimJ/RimL family protein N-acetyltransferase [Salirhabdus euzebyi]